MDRDASSSNKLSYRVKNKLTSENWFLYQREIFSDFLPAFGDAGNEIREAKEFDMTLEPLRTVRVQDRIRDHITGAIKINAFGRPWDEAIDGPELMRNRTKWEKLVDTLKSDRKSLWLLLMNSLSRSIHERVTSHADFVLLTANGVVNTLGLWKMIQSAVVTHGTNTAPQIRQRWHALRQEDPETGKMMSLRELLVEFDGHISLLKGTKSEPDDDDQVHQLITAVNKSRYSHVITTIHTGLQNYSYKDLKAALLRLEEYGSLPPLNTDGTNGEIQESAMYIANGSNKKGENKKPHFNITRTGGRSNTANEDRSGKRPRDNTSKDFVKTNPQCGNCTKFHTGKCTKDPVTCSWCLYKWGQKIKKIIRLLTSKKSS